MCVRPSGFLKPRRSKNLTPIDYLKINYNKKIVRVISLLLSVFVLSVIYALIDSDFSQISAFELGKLTGTIMRHFIKFIGILTLSVYIIRTFNINKTV